jgi:hypothetical protein
MPPLSVRVRDPLSSVYRPGDEVGLTTQDGMPGPCSHFQAFLLRSKSLWASFFNRMLPVAADEERKLAAATAAVSQSATGPAGCPLRRRFHATAR